MTREEARQVLQEKIDNRPLFKDEREAYDMAIESLSADYVIIEVHRDLYGKYIDLKHKTEWIPCSERLPEDLEAVNVTWVNHNPPMYYQHIKDVPNVDTAVYYRGAWYWWDATIIDLLGEYGGAYIHGIEPIDKDIEVTAWRPLPKPYGENMEDYDYELATEQMEHYAMYEPTYNPEDGSM